MLRSYPKLNDKYKYLRYPLTMDSFDEEITGSASHGVFGIPSKRDTSKVVLLPVAWDVTTSYGKGTAEGPQAILEASPQIDLFDTDFEESWKQGFFWDDALPELSTLNREMRISAESLMKTIEDEGLGAIKDSQSLSSVNQACEEMVDKVYQYSFKALKEKKLVGIVGGDHSSPEGLIKAIGDFYKGNFGILHIDAHHDLRISYQGFQHSHASIMYNVLNLPNPPHRLVQVGIRDFAKSEHEMAKEHDAISVYYDKDMKQRAFAGLSWQEQCEEIVGSLPDNVYISFDIDGLSPEFCPSTGTPVPGGLSYDQALYLLRSLGLSRKKIVGFDLNEVAPNPNGGEWDANVGCRLLFQLCSWTVKTQD